MIKATMGTDRSAGPDVLLLGLSWQNLDRLRKGQPIAFDMAEVDLPPMKVMIFADETEEKIMAAFEGKGLIDNETIKRGEPSGG